MPSNSSPDTRVTWVKPTDGEPEPRSNWTVGPAVAKPDRSSVICNSTVAVPPALLICVGVTEVETNTGAWPSYAGTTPLDGGDAGEIPIAVVAVTVNVYEMPFDSPATLQDRSLGPA